MAPRNCANHMSNKKIRNKCQDVELKSFCQKCAKIKQKKTVGHRYSTKRQEITGEKMCSLVGGCIRSKKGTTIM